VVAVPMAQPTAEPVEDYEYVQTFAWPISSFESIVQIADSVSNSYEGLPPNFSLLQNMTAGALAGIAVRAPIFAADV
jgi:hypothetical protein